MIDLYACIYQYVPIVFRYAISEESKRVFGLEKKGKFSGLIGVLQREEADVSTVSAPTPSRLKAVDYVHGYPPDLITIVSLQPTQLPQHLALIRPFSGTVDALAKYTNG